ncbi:MAG TPA: hypothetical protein VMZ03_13775 [Chitinophagaceae bacterium]|nr:hypothetical protein [Chitinophagaceae bacterium]
MKRITQVIAFVLIALLSSSCKKTIQNIQEDLVVKAMVDGQWKVTNFTLNGSNITTDFSTYRFKYYDNPKKVDAVKNGSVEKTGQWGGNSADNTTWANFDVAPYPLSLINGTWNITRSSWTYVEATQTSGGDTKVMRLDKE